MTNSQLLSVFLLFTLRKYFERFFFLQFRLALKLVNVLLRHDKAKSILEIGKLELLLNSRSNLETILSLSTARTLMQSNHLPLEQLNSPPIPSPPS